MFSPCSQGFLYNDPLYKNTQEQGKEYLVSTNTPQLLAQSIFQQNVVTANANLPLLRHLQICVGRGSTSSQTWFTIMPIVN